MSDVIEIERRFGADNYHPLPVVLQRGRGCHVWDTDGRQYLDMMSAYSAISHGHAHPRLLAAMQEQAARLSVVSRAFYTDQLAPFLEKACGMTGMDRALPMNTGVEAVETGIKAARKWAYEVKGVPPDTAEIIVCHGNFHGRTLAAIAMSSEHEYRHNFGPLPTGFRRVDYGDVRALEAAIGPSTAAFLVEPLQGEGGIIVPPQGYLAECAQICKHYNVLLLCDEIQTGLGRTGRLLACDHDGVKPDGLMLGKALGGGLYPVSLFLSRHDVLERIKPGQHGSTFGGNPLAAHIATEALTILTDDDLIANAQRMGTRLQTGLEKLNSKLIKDIRGRGLLIGVEFDPAKISARQVCEKLMQYGILTKETHETVVRLAPPLIIDGDLIDWAIQRVGETLEELSKQ